jgi:hypothetical protein
MGCYSTLPTISDAKLTGVLDDCAKHICHKKIMGAFARAARQAREPKAHVAITPGLSNPSLSDLKNTICLLTNDLNLSTIDRQSYRATKSRSEIGCHRDRPQLRTAIRPGLRNPAFG